MENDTAAAGRRRIVPVNFIRESKGTMGKKSQLSRCDAFTKKVLMEHPQFEGIDIDPYPEIFICAQVNRDKLTDAVEFHQLAQALRNGLPELRTPVDDDNTTVCILTVNLLRFGKTKRQIEYTTGILKTVNPNIKVEIMPFDCLGYFSPDSIAYLDQFISKEEEIHKEVATQIDQGKSVPSDPKFAKEEDWVKKKAKEFKKMFDANDELLSEITSNGLGLVDVVLGKPNPHTEWNEHGDVVKIYIGTVFGFDDFRDKCFKVFKEVDGCKLVGDDRKEFINKKVEELSDNVHPHEGAGEITAAYNRRSPKSSSVVTNGVPREQMSYNLASLDYHSDESLKELVVAIFFDDRKKRSSLANSEYVKFLALKLSGACTTVHISLPSRISERASIIELDEAVNKKMGIAGHFTKGVGKDTTQLREMEDKMHKELTENLSVFKKAKAKLMDNLPENGEPGVITREISEIADVIGKLHPGKQAIELYGLDNVENVDDDCLSVDSDWSEDEEDDEA